MLKTIRAKLLGGFIVITLMVIGLATYSVTKVEQSADSFTDYRDLARNVSIMGSVQANLLITRLGAIKYLAEPSSVAVQEFEANLKATSEDIAEAKANQTIKKNNNQPNSLAAVLDIEKALNQYQTHFNAIVSLNKEYDDIFNRTLRTNGHEIEVIFTEISRTAQNPDVIRAASESLRSLLLARIDTLLFLDQHTEETFQRAMAEFAELTAQVNLLKDDMANPERIAKFTEAVGLIQDYEQGLREIHQIFAKRNHQVEGMNQQGAQVAEITQKVRTAMRAEQNKIGPEVQALNSDIIKMMSFIGLLVTIFVIILAIVVPRIITRGLTSIQTKLTQISDSGDFSIRADDQRQDEIGIMGQAVNQLLANIQGAISEANIVVGALAAGQFDKRVTKTVTGDLNTLKEGINTSANNIADVMSQLKQVMQNLREGQFDVKLNTRAQGEYKTMIDTAADSMSAMNHVIQEINQVMSNASQGQFDQRVNVPAAGAMNDLKKAINLSVEVLENVIGDITQVMDAQSQGDLTHVVTVQCGGQLDQLKAAINKSEENLSRIINSALNNASVVSTASEEVSRGSLDLSQRVQEQAAALEETSATMDQMNSAVQNNTQNSMEATRVARDVQSKAFGGTQVMQQTIEAMNAIQESSHKISDIVTLIDGIAFQTNLLALNAAVEAARAGDHGRGFAVVAGEVRNLAQKSAEAAKDIKSLIDESVSRIDQGTKLASESGQVLKDINEAVENVSAMIDHIAEASNEQAEGISQVHKAIADIDQVTQQNAALVEETSAAAESLSEQASELSRNMAFFKTASSGHGAAVKKPATSLGHKAPSIPSGTKQKALPAKVSEQKTLQSPPAKSQNSDEWSDF